MNRWLSVSGLATGLIRPGDVVADRLIAAAHRSGGIRWGDYIVVAESAVATAEGRIVPLDDVEPTLAAHALACRYAMDPRLVEIILQESDEVVGGVPGFLLCRAHGALLPNAGVDASNAPPGCVVLLPADPEASAAGIRDAIRVSAGVETAVIVADSRPHPMRSGCAGIALGCAGLAAVRDGRAVADGIASAAELVMGEADDGIPAAIVRGEQDGGRKNERVTRRTGSRKREGTMRDDGDRWLNRTVIGAGVTSFFSDLGHEVVTVLLPSLLIVIGAPVYALGVIEGLSDGASSFVKLFSGHWSDQLGKRKEFALAGYLATAVFPAVVAVATVWPVVLLGRVIGWVGRGTRGPPRDAILAKSVPPHDLGKAFGFHRAGDTLGAIAGPLAALVLVASIGLREILWLTLIPGFLAVATF